MDKIKKKRLFLDPPNAKLSGQPPEHGCIEPHLFCSDGWIDDVLTSVNEKKDIIRPVTSKPKKIGDDAIFLLKIENDLPVERKVRFLKSEGMVKNETYLVDLEVEECWPYKP